MGFDLGTVNRVGGARPRLFWTQPDANNPGRHRPKASKTRQKRQNRSFPNIEPAFRNITEPFRNIAKSFHNIPKPFPNIVEPLPNLTGRSTILRSHFAILRNHPAILQNRSAILRNHFPILRGRFAILRSHATILRNHFLILRKHFPILRNGPERLKDRCQGCRVPRNGTRTQSETSQIEPARLGSGPGNHDVENIYLRANQAARHGKPDFYGFRPGRRKMRFYPLNPATNNVFLRGLGSNAP